MCGVNFTRILAQTGFGNQYRLKRLQKLAEAVNLQPDTP